MIYNTWNMLHSAIQFLHAINLSEDNTLACLQTVWSVVHAGYHPRIALQLQVKRCVTQSFAKEKIMKLKFR